MVPLPRNQPRTIMIANQRNNSINGVNGSTAAQRAPAPGRYVHSRRVTLDRQPATAGGSAGHAERVSGSRDRATARIDRPRRIATWNVNTLHQAGKIENLKKEAQRLKLDIVGVSEARWTGSGRTVTGDWIFYHSGGQKHEHGVGILIKKEIDAAVKGCWQLSDRVMLLKIGAKPVSINIIQVYAPTSQHSDDTIDGFYDQVDEVRRQCKSNEVTIVMGDLNAKVGRGRSGDAVGDFGLGVRNERGDKWVDWCESWGQVIMNTNFIHHPRHLYTWKSPGDRTRNQIDYLTINRRFRNSITQVKTYPGADLGLGCDHVPVVATMKVKLKKVKKRKKIRKDWKRLRTETQLKEAYANEVKNRYERLAEDRTVGDIDNDWSMLQNSLVEAAEEMIPREPQGRRQMWMTQDILELMEERRKFKNRADERYRELDQLIKRMCKDRKEEWLQAKCEELEPLERIDSRLLAEKIREITGKKRPARSTIIKDRDGTILTERSEVLRRWKEYVGELYGDNEREEVELENVDSGCSVLRSEVEHAVRKMKWRKAEGSDGIVVEMLEALGDFATEKLTDLANKIHSTGMIPQRMQESEFIVIPKKAGAVDCSKHRTISIMSQVAKIVLKVLDERLKGKIAEHVDEEQYGFRKGKGTRNAIFVLRMIMERLIEKQKDIYMCFVDFEKAFDTVKHNCLIETLKKYGVDGRDIRVMAQLYWQQKAVVRIGEDSSEWINIEKGVRQGCVLSPDLFSLYTQIVMDELAEYEGVKIGGRNINNIRYADDMVMIADSQEKLQTLMDKLILECSRVGLRINKGKTEVMGITKRRDRLPVTINVEGSALKQVETFRYLGSLVCEDARCDAEIKTRIGIAKANFGSMRKVLTNMNISIHLRLRLLRCYVWSGLLYGCESWNISSEMQKRLEATEMWFIRRMLRVPWTARRTNVEVMRMAGTSRKLVTTIRQRQLRYLGHVLRAESLEKDCLLGTVEGTRARGRQRLKYMDGIKKLVGCSGIGEVIRLAQNREEWRIIIDNVYIDTSSR